VQSLVQACRRVDCRRVDCRRADVQTFVRAFVRLINCMDVHKAVRTGVWLIDHIDDYRAFLVVY